MSGYGRHYNNKFAQNPQRRPPAGWKVENILWQKVLADAQRTGDQTLIDRVRQMENAPRHDLVLIANTVSQAAKGLISPKSVDVDKLLRKI